MNNINRGLKIKYVAAFVLQLLFLVGYAKGSTQSEDSGLSVKRLNLLFDDLHQMDGVKNKKQINDSIERILIRFLSNKESFVKVPKEERIGKIVASDNKINLYTWNYQDKNLRYHYNGIIQYMRSSKSEPVLFVLNDNNDEISENGIVKANNWYGALYYSVIVTQYKKETFYTLLGWDGNDGIIARKVIDNFKISSDNELKFGYPIFKGYGKTKSRIIFSYSAQGAMMLAYDENYKRIVFDHLSPNVASNKNKFQYYGADFTYDAFQFKKGKWLFERNIDVRNKDFDKQE